MSYKGEARRTTCSDGDSSRFFLPERASHYVFDVIEGNGLATCPQCETQYPFRKGKIYCSPNCRKAASRGIQNSRTSKAKARDNYEFFDTARRMGETLYSLPLSQRLGHMKELIDEARAGNTALREILSNYKLRHPNPKDDSWMFPRGHRAYCTIAQAADRYCRKFWGAYVTDVVYNKVPEPDDGQIEKASHHIIEEDS